MFYPEVARGADEALDIREIFICSTSFLLPSARTHNRTAILQAPGTSAQVCASE